MIVRRGPMHEPGANGQAVVLHLGLMESRLVGFGDIDAPGVRTRSESTSPDTPSSAS